MAERQSFLSSLPDEERAQLLAHCSRARFPAGAAVIQQGDVGAGVYVVLTGSAEVVVAGPAGEPRELAVVGPGDLLGEVALFSGQPASSTVRALTDVEALAVDGGAAVEAARELPWLYRRLGAVVADRLVRTQRQLLAVPAGRVVVLRDAGAPPRLPMALGASVAWHTRAPVLVVLAAGAGGSADDVPVASGGEALAALAATSGPPGASRVVRLAETCSTAEVAAAVRRAVELVPTVLLVLPPHLDVAVGADLDVPLAPPAAGRQGPAVVAWARAAAPGCVPVREPQGDELTDVSAGRIGARGPAGADLGRAARWLLRSRVGLALGSGSARGFAHVGVLRTLARAGVPVDAVAGTSIGAAVAALHALGNAPEHIAETLTQAGRLAMRPLGTGRSLLSIAGLRKLIERESAGRRFESLPVPLAVVAADVDTGEEIVFRRGTVAPAVLASLAIPGVYPPQHVAGRRLIDGAFVDPVPVRVAASLGADRVIAVRLAARPPAGNVEPESAVTRGEALWAPQVILRSIDVMSGAIAANAAGHADVLVEPVFSGLGGGLRDFRRGAEYERVGAEAVEAALPALGALLPWLDA